MIERNQLAAAQILSNAKKTAQMTERDQVAAVWISTIGRIITKSGKVVKRRQSGLQLSEDYLHEVVKQSSGDRVDYNY